MRTRIKPRLTYANVMATIAVFGVLAGGGAYAASQIGPKDIKKNAVRAKHIKKNQVRTKHIKKNQVHTKHVKDGAVTAEKLADGVEGPQGPPGPQGDTGDQGPQGPAGSAAAYAQIAGGDVVDGFSFNIDDADVANPSTGVYCIGGLPFDPKNAVATPEATSALDSRDRITSVLLSGPGTTPFGCAAGDRIRVQVIDLGVLGTTGAGFTDNFVFIWVED